MAVSPPKPLNPFNAQTLAQYKAFFQPPPRKGLPTDAELEAERSGLASFLGTTDYAQQLAEDRQLSKLQLGLALAQRGFGSMGAQPRPGEMAISTVGRELLSPLAGDAGAIATQMLQQRRALKTAQEQEERQLKLAALGQVQTRQSQEYADDLEAARAAREFLITTKKMDVTVSDAFTVGGVPVPVIVERDWRGNVRYLDANNNEIPANKIGVYKAAKVIKDSVTNVSDLERIVVDSETGEETYRPIVAERVVSFNSDGSVKSTVLRDTTNDQILNLSGPDKNARKAPEEGSRTSLYHAPARKNIYLNQTFVDAFGLPDTMVGTQAGLEISSPKPVIGAGLPDIVKIRVGGRTYTLRDHKNYNSETGNIELETLQGIVTLDSSQLWGLDDPKAFTALPGPGLTVTPENLAEIQKIPGLSGIKSGEKLTAERNPAGDIQIRYGRQVISLTKAQEALFQTGDLTAVQQLEAGQVPVTWTAKEVLRVPVNNLAEIQKIPGLSDISVNETLRVEEDESGNWRFLRGGEEIALTSEQQNLFVQRPLSEVEEIQAGMKLRDLEKVSELRVGDGDLSALQAIPGLTSIGRNETIDIHVRKGDPDLGIPTEREYWYAGTKVDIPSDILESGILQSAPLSEVQQVELGLTEQDSVSYVNTSTTPKSIHGVGVGVGQRYNLTKNEYTALVEADPTAAQWLQAAGPVDTAAVTYTFKDFRKIGRTDSAIHYSPGDQITFTPSEYDALPDEMKNVLTDDPDIKKEVLKKNGFKALWKTVARENKLGDREPSDAELNSLMVMFPAGMRSGGKFLRTEIFGMLKYGADPDKLVPPPVRAAINQKTMYQDSVATQLAAAKERYEGYVAKGALAEVPWNSLSFEARRAFADLPSIVQIRNVRDLWDKSITRLETEKSKFATLDSDDVAAYAAATELLILAKYLRNSSDIDKTGKFLGFWGGLQADIFADITPLTSGGSQRIQQIINTMKSRYATLAGTEGEGRQSNFRLQLMQNLVPAFTQSEALNIRNLDIMIGRLEATMRSAFTPEVMSATVIPRSFVRMAAEAGVAGKIDPTRYRWLDPSLEGPLPVTRQRVMEKIGLVPYSFVDAQDLRVGLKLPAAPNNNVVYVKIRNNEDGSVVVKEADSDGRPKKDAEEITLTADDWK